MTLKTGRRGPRRAPAETGHAMARSAASRHTKPSGFAIASCRTLPLRLKAGGSRRSSRGPRARPRSNARRYPKSWDRRWKFQGGRTERGKPRIARPTRRHHRATRQRPSPSNVRPASLASRHVPPAFARRPLREPDFRRPPRADLRAAAQLPGLAARGRRPAPPAFTAIFRGRSSAIFGIRTVNTPCLRFASILPASSSLLSAKSRR